MHAWIRFIGAVPLLALACASGGWKSESSTAPDADLAAYVSFGWLPDASEAALSVRDARLRAAIRKELVAKGYREDEASPDLRIGFATEAHAKEQTKPPMRVGIGVGSWTGPVGVGADTSVPVGKERVTTVSETRLTINAVDPNGNRELWTGSATGEVREDSDESTLDQAVAAALDGFPTRQR